ncbi:MAG: recombinase family protein [Planctomycetes bacterium]|nr:recombinase family protein [Planctomycetota bacterium]
MKAYFYGRFSQKRQEKGNSLLRQLELAHQWCKQKGVSLDEQSNYFDEGLSGFHGTHRKRGKLGLFLQACREKQIERGSYLLVESLDRLSREHLFHGQALVRELLLDHGIRIVTLFTNVEFTAENYEVTHWLIDAEFQRAHSESKTKSFRSLDNWQRRRQSLAEKPLTAKVPAWVQVVDGKLVENTTKADVVRRIFALSVQGFGTQSITKRLNGEKVQPISPAKMWHESYVVKILSSRAVMGDFQPQQMNDGKRVNAGPVVRGYFPSVVTEEVWQQNRNAMLARRCERGKITKKVSNLFTGLVWQNGEQCSYRATNFTGYLQPARRTTPGFKYEPFERAFLWWVKEVRLCTKQDDGYATVKAQADALERQIRILDAKIKADSSLIEEGYLDELTTLKKRHRTASEKADAASVPLQSHFLHGQRLVDALKTAKGEELETMRRALRMTIRQVVVGIDVRVVGDKYSGKYVLSLITLKDGQTHLFYYTLKAGRVVDGGCHYKMQRGEFEKLPDLVRNGLTPDVGFPVDTDPLGKIKTTCKRMRLEEGQSYKEIMAATGLDRITIYRYVFDYQRPKQMA